MNKTLLSLLVCPVCKRKLSFIKKLGFRCKKCRKKFYLKHGIPVLVDVETFSPHQFSQIRYFQRESSTYTSEPERKPWQLKYAGIFFNCLGKCKGKVIVDNACGSGYMAIEAVKRGAKVEACDLNISGLIRLKKIIDKLGYANRVLLICCSAEQLPICRNCANDIVANAILEHLSRENEAIFDISRIARKNAIAMITVRIAYHLLNPIFLLMNYIYDRKIGHLRRYTIENLSSLF